MYLLYLALAAAGVVTFIGWRSVSANSSRFSRVSGYIGLSGLFIGAICFVALYWVANYSNHALTDSEQMWFVRIVLPLLVLSTIGLLGSMLAQSTRRARQNKGRQPLTDGVPVPIRLNQGRERFQVMPPPPSHRP